MNIMFTSGGRRVELINDFKETIKDSLIIAGDFDETSPVNYFVDKTYKLPFIIDENYMKEIFSICKKENIDVVIPLIDYELDYYAKYKKLFMDHGIMMLISDEKFISLSLDKLLTSKVMNEINIMVPKTTLLEDYCGQYSEVDKVILKPRKGSASKGIYTIEGIKVGQFVELLGINKNSYIVQEYIESEYELTVDVFIDHKSNIVELCQRKRLKVRAGEVERSVTVYDERVTKLVELIVKEFKPFGVINIQFLYSLKDNEFYLVEINPRFGGGYPHSFKAGANFIEHIKNERLGRSHISYLNNRRYKKDYYCFRYDNAVYKESLT